MVRRILVLDSADGPLQALVRALREAVGGAGAEERPSRRSPRGTGDGFTPAPEPIGPSARIELCPDGDALSAAAREACDIALVDFPRGDGTCSGHDVLARLRAEDPDLPLVAVAPRGDVSLAAQAIAAGASDFLVTGAELDARVRTLLAKVGKVADLVHRHRALQAQCEQLERRDRERYRIVGDSAAIHDVLDRIERVARIPRPVLVVGERGTGKELVARAIHAASGRTERPFVAVNCAALPEPLLEAELFGHERGAFTGAEQRRPGKFEQAQAGTLFLDEIGNMPLAFQQKILRVIEYGVYHRLGGSQELQSRARIVAATNTDLAAAIREGRFLQDLHDRLAFEVLRVPPLRERAGDLERLARHFLEEFLKEVPALGAKTMSAEAIEVLRGHPFPGNVRELKNTIERAAYRDRTQRIDPEDIDLAACAPAALTCGGFAEQIALLEQRLVREALADSGGNQAEAARRLGLSYDQFRHHYKKQARG